MSVNQEIIDRRRRVLSLTRERYSCEQIAQRLDVSRRTVQRDRVALGLNGPPPNPYTDEEKTAIITMLEEGVNYAEVARTVGRAHSVIVRKFPGYELDRYQIAECASWGRKMARI